MEERFEEFVATEARLRELKGAPGIRSRKKEIDRIDDICRRFIAASPFLIVASRGGDGRLDLSPKGDPPGFVKVLDEKTLAIPDRLGNGRLDTFENLLIHPEVALIFLIPGNGDTLRVSGKGQIVRDAMLQNEFIVNGKSPDLVLLVSVEQAFMHCPKCVLRSGLWSPDRWPSRANVPKLAEALVTHAALSDSISEVQAVIDRDAATRLY